MKILSMRRKTVDFAALIAKDPKKRAVGNASMNARGDIVKHGKIVKTREQIMTEYNENHPQTVKNTGIRSISSEMFVSPEEAVAQARAQQQAQQQAQQLQQVQQRPSVSSISQKPPIVASSNTKPKPQRRLIQNDD